MKDSIKNLFAQYYEQYNNFKKFIPHYVIGTLCFTFALSFSLIFSNFITTNFINNANINNEKTHIKDNGKLPSEYKIGKPYEVAIKDKKKPLVVEFYADWCPHCKNMTPVFKKASKSITKANFATVNTQIPENEFLTTKYNVNKYPTIIIIDTKTGNFEELEITQNLFNNNGLKEELKRILTKYTD